MDTYQDSVLATLTRNKNNSNNSIQPMSQDLRHRQPEHELTYLPEKGQSSETDIRTRLHLAENISTPVWLLRELAADTNEVVRQTVAENPQLPIMTLLKLANDQSCDVRHALAENHNIPLAILCILACDDNPYVSSRAHRTISRCTSNNVAALYSNLPTV